MSSKDLFTIRLLVPLLFIGCFMATDIYLPSLPNLTQVLHGTTEQSQLTLTVYLFSFAISQIIYGTLSDKYGRKPILLLGLSIFIIGSLVTVYAGSMSTLLLGRLIQGAGIGAVGSLSRVVMMDSFSGIELVKIMSIAAMVISIAPMLAPALGGFIQQYLGYQYNFYAMFFYGVFLLLATLFFLPETIQYKNQSRISLRTVMKNAIVVVKVKQFRQYCLISGIGFSIIMAYSMINPFLLQKILHLTPSQYGIALLAIGMGMILGNFSNSQLIKAYSSEQLVRAALMLVIASASMMTILGLIGILTVSSVIAPLFIIIFSFGIIFPNVSILALAPFDKNRGAAGALFGMLQMLLSALSGYIVLMLPYDSVFPLGAFILVLSLLAFRAQRLTGLKTT